MNRQAHPGHPIHELLIKRHSRYAFAPRDKAPRNRMPQSDFLLPG